MTPEKLARLKVLQRAWSIGPISDAERIELESLRRELAMAPEVADDPRTPFVNEASRPQLDGSNYNDTLKQMACDEVVNFAKLLAARVGVPLAEAALQAGIAALKR